MAATERDIDLTGRVALVSGASKGIGLGVARAYARHGASVMISSRREENLVEAIDTIEGEAAYRVANAGDPDDARECVAGTIERFGRLDILVNNAATTPYVGPLIDIDLPRFDKTVSTNLRGPLVWTQEAWRQWMATHGGSVVNMVSVGAFTTVGELGAYNTTKSALTFMTKHLATELGPGVRVNAIAPGLVKTDFARALWEGRDDDDNPWPMARLGRPEDVAGAALFLASDLSAWVTGDVLMVDGGALVASTSIR